MMKQLLKTLSIAIMTGTTLSIVASAQTPSTYYSWIADYDQDNRLEARIAPPSGYYRKNCADGSFCNWLRNVPLKPEGSPVRYHSGIVKTHAQHYAVLDLDTGKRDLQQCADAVMRLKAEYHYARGEYSKIHFNYTSGHKVSFDDWRRGRKPVVRGNKVSFTNAGGSTDNSYRNFKKYLIQIFSYAGSLSLEKELRPVAVKDIRPGDVFIVGGSPGHAVMVMDVAENTSGQKMFLLAQSYMPAQDMHILENPYHAGEGPWYSAEIADVLYTPEWHFKPSDLKRFR